MFKKNQKVEVVDPRAEGMTYTELVSQELDAEMNRLRKAEKELTNGVNELLVAAKEKGNNRELTLLITKLRQRLDVNAEQLKQAGVKYAVDLDLKIMALTLDRADGTNKGIDIFSAIGHKVNEILDMLPELERCYGGEYYAPILYTQIKKGMQGLAMQFNNELTKLNRVDKNTLEKNLYNRLEVLRENKGESEAITDRYKNF